VAACAGVRVRVEPRDGPFKTIWEWRVTTRLGGFEPSRPDAGDAPSKRHPSRVAIQATVEVADPAR